MCKITVCILKALELSKCPVAVQVQEHLPVIHFSRMKIHQQVLKKIHRQVLNCTGLFIFSFSLLPYAASLILLKLRKTMFVITLVTMIRTRRIQFLVQD